MESRMIARSDEASGISWTQASRQLLLAGLHNRLVLVATAIGVSGAGLALGWTWLTAAGIAPLIVSAAPCLIMCALGVCMMGRSGQPSGQPALRANEPEKPQSGQQQP